MKFKRFHGVDIKQAINKVRDELGSDAVILSNRKTPKGVEIIAAIDYDEAMLDEVDNEEPAPIKDDFSELKPTVSVNNNQMASFLAQTKKCQETADDEPFWKKIMAESYGQEDKVSMNASAPINADLVRRRLAESYQSNNQELQPRKTVQPYTHQSNTDLRQTKKTNSISSQSIPRDLDNLDKTVNASVQPVHDETDSVNDVWKELNDLRGLLEKQLSSLAWGDLARRSPQRAQVLRRLIELGLSSVVSRRLIREIREHESFDVVWKKALTVLAKGLPVSQDVFIENGGVYALVGPTGVGKTTTLAKIAARFVLRRGTENIALVTTDSFRIGAQEQLRTYGRILDVPVRVANDADELKKVLKSLYEKKLVLIDTAGISQRDIRLTEQFAMLSEGAPLIKTFLVLSAASQVAVMDEAVRAYQRVVLDGCILTKIDEASLLGGALSILYHHKLPMIFLSDGQRVPEDLHNVRSVELLKRAVTMMHKANHRIAEEELEMAFGGAVDDIR